jgi:serine/threonine protein kinase
LARCDVVKFIAEAFLKVTNACDIYSLGVIIWEMVTGQSPWQGLSIADMKARVNWPAFCPENNS